MKRIPHPTDPRATLVRLTAEGRDVGRRASKVLTDIRFGIRLDDPAAEALITKLHQLRASMADQ